MAEIQLDCPHCGQHLEGDDGLCGQNINCPSCSGEIAIPAKGGVRPAARVARITASATSPSETGDEERELLSLQPTAKAFLGTLILGVILLPFIVGLFLLLYVWYKVVSLKYRLTTQRLFVQKGLIAKRLDEIELFRIKDVTVHQGILQRILGFGTINVLSTDDSNPHVSLIGINRPVNVKETIRNSFRAARKREGVRAAEFIAS